MDLLEVLFIAATSLATLVCAWAAMKYTFKADTSAQADASVGTVDTGSAHETPRFERLLHERWFGIVFYLALAVLSGGVAHFIYRNTTDYIDFARILFIYLAGLAAMVIDLRYHRIPNVISLILLAGRGITIAYEFLFLKEAAMSRLVSSLLGLVILFIVLFGLSKLIHNGIGLGDVKLLSAIGFMGGIYAVCSILLLSLLSSCLISIGLIASKQKKIKDYIPFAPFIFAGIVLTIILGVF